MKEKILKALIAEVEEDLKKAQEAYNSTSAYKNSDDLKQEGKYDTRAIESGYLAAAQLKRLDELKLELQLLHSIELRDYSKGSPIAMGALVDMEINHKRQKYFLCTTGGGKILKIDEQIVLIISVFSPLGKEILGSLPGDPVSLETPSGMKNYLIISAI